MMNLKTKLMHHQNPAVEKLLPIKVGALFMEMGTGKTRTAIEIIHRRQAKISKVVWFCPVSLKKTLWYELKKHTNSLDNDIYCFDHKTNQNNIPEVFFYIVGIESMSLSTRVILTINYLIDENTFVIVDESSYIKGHRSARTNWITNTAEKAKYRMILTGTPISQGVVDLFSQFRFLSPKILGYQSFYSFAANHLEYSDKFPDMIVRAHNTEWIAAKIKPYVYQITKDECLDLPDKLYETRYFSMTYEQREWYERIKEETLAYVEEWDSYTIFQLFSKLQQIVCGFLNKKQLTFEHKRIEVLQDIIHHIPSDEKIIIWCKYEYDIYQITAALGHDNIAQFYGKIPIRQRDRSICEFRDKKRFFLATESCGGHGLTLNESHYTIFYNNGFKYAERMQAEDRNHRIGQNKSVTYIDIICSDSIDERIDQAIYNKGSIVQSFKNEIEAVKDQKNKLKNLIKRL